MFLKKHMRSIFLRKNMIQDIQIQIKVIGVMSIKVIGMSIIKVIGMPIINVKNDLCKNLYFMISIT